MDVTWNNVIDRNTHFVPFATSGILTKKTVAETIPDACCRIPNPASFYAGNKGKVNPEQRHQQIAYTYVDHEQISGRLESLKFVVEHNDKDVVAETKDSDRSDGEGKKFVSASAEKVVIWLCIGPTFIRRIHCLKNSVSGISPVSLIIVPGIV